MSTRVLVTGGTGILGSHVLERLRVVGRPARVLSRRPRADVPPTRDHPGVEFVVGDALTGEGLDDAFAGGGTLLHLAGDARHDVRSTEGVVDAARRAGVDHLVLISVTCADRIPIGYYRGKAASERLVAESGLAFTVLRAAQFHEFVLSTLGSLARLPVAPDPGLRAEPVDVGEVADRLVELAAGEPRGRVPELAGPEVLDVRGILGPLRGGRRVRTVPIRIPGSIGRTYRDGANLVGPAADRGTRTWGEWVAERVGGGR